MYKKLKEFFNNLFSNWFGLLIIVFGTFIILAIIFPNGDRVCFDANSCGVAVNKKYFHDSMFHIALAKSSFNSIPFTNPAQSGSSLIGYNYLLDFFIFIASKFGINPWLSFFKLFPLIFVLLYPLLIIRYCLRTKKSRTLTNFILFFCYFGSSLGFIFAYIHKNQFADNGSLWQFPSALVLQSGTMLYSLQYAFSLLAIVFFMPFLQKRNFYFKDYIFFAVGTFIATGLKFFAGISIFVIFFIRFLLQFFLLRTIKKRELLLLLSIVFGFFISIIMIYRPFESLQSGSIFVFAPFSFSHQLIENPLLFYSRSLADARYYLYAQKTFSEKLILIEIYSVILFILYNLGTRIVSVYILIKDFVKKTISIERICFVGTFLVSLVFVTLFVQKGDWFNTMQFLFYGVFFMNFVAAETLYIIFQNKSLIRHGFVLLIIVVTLLGNIDILSFYNRSPENYHLITENEVKALRFLENQPSGSIFSTSIDTLYISAFAGKPSFFSDKQILSITCGYSRERERIVKNIEKVDFKRIDAKYFYLNTKKDLDKRLSKKIKKNKYFRQIYKKDGIEIFRVL